MNARLEGLLHRSLSYSKCVCSIYQGFFLNPLPHHQASKCGWLHSSWRSCLTHVLFSLTCMEYKSSNLFKLILALGIILTWGCPWQTEIFCQPAHRSFLRYQPRRSRSNVGKRAGEVFWTSEFRLYHRVRYHLTTLSLSSVPHLMDFSLPPTYAPRVAMLSTGHEVRWFYLT